MDERFKRLFTNPPCRSASARTVSAVISGPIGFVLGFYFRESPSS